MPRLAPLDLNKLTPEQKKVADAIVRPTRRASRALQCASRSPQLAISSSARRLLRFGTSIPQRLNEMAIAWSVGTSRRSTSSTRIAARPRSGIEPGHRRCDRSDQRRPAWQRRGDRLRLRLGAARDGQCLGPDVPARQGRFRRAASSIWSVRRLLQPGVDDAERLAGAAARRVSRTRWLRHWLDRWPDELPAFSWRRRRSSPCRRGPASFMSPRARWPMAAESAWRRAWARASADWSMSRRAPSASRR